MEYIDIPCFDYTKICMGKFKCNICYLDAMPNECVHMYEIKEKNLKIKSLKRQLPESCVNCPFLEIINLDKMQVHCPYMVKDKCIIE